jgi:hypothetical protein
LTVTVMRSITSPWRLVPLALRTVMVSSEPVPMALLAKSIPEDPAGWFSMTVAALAACWRSDCSAGFNFCARTVAIQMTSPRTAAVVTSA